MKYTLRYRPEVISDLAEAVSWYEARVPGLGGRFLREYLERMRFIRSSAGVPRRMFGDFRRVLLKRFPFAVWYEIEGDTAIILLVWDCRQNPERLGKMLRSR